jgi:hypothetical protein
MRELGINIQLVWATALLPKPVMAYCRHPANIRVYCTDPSPTRLNLPELAMNCASLARGMSRNWSGLNESKPNLLYLRVPNLSQNPTKWALVSTSSCQHCRQFAVSARPIFRRWYCRVLCPVNIWASNLTDDRALSRPTMPGGASGLHKNSLDCRQPVVLVQRISCSLQAQFLTASLTVAPETAMDGSGPTNLISEARLARSSAALFPSIPWWEGAQWRNIQS